MRQLQAQLAREQAAAAAAAHREVRGRERERERAASGEATVRQRRRIVGVQRCTQRCRKWRIVTVGVSVWEIAHGAVSRCPPISLDKNVARTEGYTNDVGVWDLSIVQGPFSVAPCRTLTSRFATFASLHGAQCSTVHGQASKPPGRLEAGRRSPPSVSACLSSPERHAAVAMVFKQPL